MREHLATAAAIGVILGVLGPELDLFGPAEAEAARIAPLCTSSNCTLPKPESVQGARSCSGSNFSRPEEEPVDIAAPSRGGEDNCEGKLVLIPVQGGKVWRAAPACRVRLTKAE